MLVRVQCILKVFSLYQHFVDCKGKEKNQLYIIEDNIRSSTSNNVFHKIKGMCEVVVICF